MSDAGECNISIRSKRPTTRLQRCISNNERSVKVKMLCCDLGTVVLFRATLARSHSRIAPQRQQRSVAGSSKLNLVTKTLTSDLLICSTRCNTNPSNLLFKGLWKLERTIAGTSTQKRQFDKQNAHLCPFHTCAAHDKTQNTKHTSLD